MFQRKLHNHEYCLGAIHEHFRTGVCLLQASVCNDLDKGKSFYSYLNQAI